MTLIARRIKNVFACTNSRDPITYESNKGYPCGEGAGYAGGIISAAIDGRKCFDDWESLHKKTSI
jgi:uncharacterized FAD-dependent dehydrogenase